MFKTITLTLIALAMFSSSICSAKNISVGEKLTLFSNVLNEDRELWIYKPQNYNKDNAYHVLYLLDAKTHFHTATGVVKYLTENNFIPQTIVVALPNTNRVRDFTPPIDGEPQSRMQKFINKKFPQSGGADNFLNFMDKELIPFIDKKYSTVPHRTLVGHSNGGLFSLYSLVTKPNLFANYIIMSPSGWWSEKEIDSNIENLVKTEETIKGNLFLTVGNEGNQILSNALSISADLERLSMKEFSWEFTHMTEESHMSITMPSLYKGLKAVFAEFKISDLDEISQYSDISSVEKFYQNLSKKYNYSVEVPATIITQLANKHLQYGQPKKAVLAYQSAVKQEPNSAFAHKNLGDGYMATSEYSLAKDSYKIALNLATKQKSEHLDYFQDMLKNAEAKM